MLESLKGTADVIVVDAHAEATADKYLLLHHLKGRVAAVLGTLAVAVRQLTEAIAPVTPASADKLLALIASGSGGEPIAQPVPIFPRLELDDQAEAAQ